MFKCLKCPYKLGLVKCVIDPCPQCKESKCKEPPFPAVEIKEDKNAVDTKFK